METISAPFTDEQVEALTWFQRGTVMQPFHCRNSENICGEILTATNDGLKCLVCGYIAESVPANLLAFALQRVNADPLGATGTPAEAPKKKRGKK